MQSDATMKYLLSKRSTGEVGMGDPPATYDDGRASVEAYALVGFGTQSPIASHPLPHKDSALLLHREWQTFSMPLDRRVASSTTVHLEICCWVPMCGERSLGRMSYSAEQVVRGGRMEIAAPCGIGIEIDWLPPQSTFEGDALAADSSGVRFTTTAVIDDGLPSPSHGRYIWKGGSGLFSPADEPFFSPSEPATIGGLPPSRPAAEGSTWVWGNTQWHEVPSPHHKAGLGGRPAAEGSTWVWGNAQWHERA